MKSYYSAHENIDRSNHFTLIWAGFQDSKNIKFFRYKNGKPVKDIHKFISN